MSKSFSSDKRCCATCGFWDGERVAGKGVVIVDSRDKECYKRKYKVSCEYNCKDWIKWWRCDQQDFK